MWSGILNIESLPQRLSAIIISISGHLYTNPPREP